MEYYEKIWYDKDIKGINENKYFIMLNRTKEEQEEFINCLNNNKVVKRCMEELNKLNEDPIFREYMSYEEDQRKIFNSRMRYATEQGLKNGFEKGIKEGIIQTAKKFLEAGVDINIISKSTGLTIDELNKL